MIRITYITLFQQHQQQKTRAMDDLLCVCVKSMRLPFLKSYDLISIQNMIYFNLISSLLALQSAL